MNPCLLQNDLLFWVPVTERSPGLGDVILFHASYDCKVIIIHRIVRVLAKRGFITRGDNNLHPDPGILACDDVIGVVIGGWRGDKKIWIPSGFTGVIVYHVAQSRKISLSILSTLFLKQYYMLAKKKWLLPFIPKKYLQRYVLIKTSAGYDIQVYLGDRLVGWKKNGMADWEIIPPFRICIDDTDLPDDVHLLLDEPE